MEATNDERHWAYELIEMGLKLMPEGETLDISDLEFSVEQTVAIKARLSRMRSTIDEVNRALGAAWRFNHPNVNSIEVGEDLYYLKPSQGKKWAPTGAQLFAEWAVKQDPTVLARALSASGVKVGQISPELRASVLDEEPRNDDPRIQMIPGLMRKGR